MTSDPAKHAIPKTAEVAYSIGVGELGWQYGTGLKSHGIVTNWCTGRGWPVTCMTVIFARWWSKHAIPKTAEVTYSVGHLWEEIEWAWIYYITQCTGNSISFGDQKSWRNDAVEKIAPSRELGPWASGWATLENEKDTRLCPEEPGRSICFNSVRSPTPSLTQQRERYIFLKNCVARLNCVVVMISHAYVFVWLVIYTTIVGVRRKFKSVQSLEAETVSWLPSERGGK